MDQRDRRVAARQHSVFTLAAGRRRGLRRGPADVPRAHRTLAIVVSGRLSDRGSSRLVAGQCVRRPAGAPSVRRWHHTDPRPSFGVCPAVVLTLSRSRAVVGAARRLPASSSTKPSSSTTPTCRLVDGDPDGVDRADAPRARRGAGSVDRRDGDRSGVAPRSSRPSRNSSASSVRRGRRAATGSVCSDARRCSIR